MTYEELEQLEPDLGEPVYFNGKATEPAGVVNGILGRITAQGYNHAPRHQKGPRLSWGPRDRTSYQQPAFEAVVHDRLQAGGGGVTWQIYYSLQKRRWQFTARQHIGRVPGLDYDEGRFVPMGDEEVAGQ